MSEDCLKGGLLGFCLGGIIMGVVGLIGIYSTNSIPCLKREKLEQDYVNPDNLEIKLEDFNGNDKEEVVMQYKTGDGKEVRYLMKWNGENIELRKYEVKCPEIIEK